MNWRRLLTRLWMIGSLFWFAYVFWLVGSGSTFPDPNLLVTITLTIVPPIGVFGLGIAVAWVMQRFRQEHRHD